MAEANTASTAPAVEAAEKPPKKKKLRPTNCAQSNKRIRRKDWYYRDGKYFANKACYKLWKEAQEAEKQKAAEAGKAAKAAEAAKAQEAVQAPAAPEAKTEEKAAG